MAWQALRSAPPGQTTPLVKLVGSCLAALDNLSGSSGDAGQEAVRSLCLSILKGIPVHSPFPIPLLITFPMAILICKRLGGLARELDLQMDMIVSLASRAKSLFQEVQCN